MRQRGCFPLRPALGAAGGVFGESNYHYFMDIYELLFKVKTPNIDNA